MSWADGVLSVWSWGKQGLLATYDQHLRPAAAVALGAYGAHVLNVAKEGVTEEQRKAFEVANRYHLIHSVALLGVALVRKPRVTGVLMVGGMATFCGTTYYHAFTGDKQYRKLTPYGGILLIAAWLSMTTYYHA